MTPDPNLIGLAFRARRDAYGFSVDALATAAAVPAELVVQLERGEIASATLESLEAVADALGTPLVAILVGPAPTTTAAADPVETERAFRAQLPIALQSFLSQEELVGRPIDGNALRALACIPFESSAPSTPEDWRILYEAILEGLCAI